MDTQLSGDNNWSLLQGERVLWSGAPRQGLLLSSRDVFLIPFSLLWGGFAIFWEIAVWHTHAPALFRIWGVPFVLIGLYLIAGRFAVDAWLRGSTRYAVTNRRILIKRFGPWANITALSLDRLPEVQLNQRADGSGTLRFGNAPAAGWGGRSGFGGWSPALDPTPQFIAIENAQSVFDQIQRAIRGGE